MNDKIAYSIIGILFLAVLGLGIWTMQEGASPTPSPTPTPTQTQTPTQPEPGDQEPTNNWKTYRNEEYGYEIGHPGELSEIEDLTMSSQEKAERKQYGTLSFSQEKQLNLITFGDQVQPYLSVTIYNNSNNKALKQFATEVVTGTADYKLKDLKFSALEVDSHKAVKITYKNKIGGYDGLVSPIFIKRTNRVYRLFLFGITGETSYEDLFNQILSTFKFIK